MKNTFLIFALLIAFSAFGQIKGKITYRIASMKDSLEQPYENPQNTDARNNVLEMLHEAQPVEGFLIFNGDRSTYYLEEKKEIPKWTNHNDVISITPSKINLTRMVAGGEGITYNDFSRMFHIKQIKVFGKTKRLINNTSRKWILKDETKDINGYKCHLAIIEKLNDKVLKAWYTKEIPTKHAPKNLLGLTGLIIKIEDGIYTWIASEIDLESKEADVIEEPKEGDIITFDDYKRLAGNPFGKKEK